MDIIKILIFLCVLGFLDEAHAQEPQVITINVKNVDQLNLSEISESVVAIPLNLKDQQSLFKIKKVFLTKEHIFIVDGSKKNKGFPDRLLQFDRLGQFIRQIGQKEQLVDVLLDGKRKHIIVHTRNRIKYYDLKNKAKLIKSIERNETLPLDYLYNNTLWDVQQDGKNYFLRKMEIGKNTTDTIYSFSDPKVENGEEVIFGAFPTFSVSAQCLYVAFRIDNKLHQVQPDKIKTVYHFKLINHLKLKKLDNYMGLPQFFIGKYFHFGYTVNFGKYAFIYNTLTEKSYNVKFEYDSKSSLTSGIYDDIHKSGYVAIRPTNDSNHFWFSRYVSELKGKIKGDGSESDFVLFLAKIK